MCIVYENRSIDQTIDRSELPHERNQKLVRFWISFMRFFSSRISLAAAAVVVVVSFSGRLIAEDVCVLTSSVFDCLASFSNNANRFCVSTRNALRFDESK